jgi:hypothetical protein
LPVIVFQRAGKYFQTGIKYFQLVFKWFPNLRQIAIVSPLGFLLINLLAILVISWNNSEQTGTFPHKQHPNHTFCTNPELFVLILHNPAKHYPNRETTFLVHFIFVPEKKLYGTDSINASAKRQGKIPPH